MEQKTHTITYVLLTILVVALVTLVYIYLQVTWQQQRTASDPAAIDQAAQQDAILNMETSTEGVVELSDEEKVELLEVSSEGEVSAEPLTVEEQEALLNQ